MASSRSRRRKAVATPPVDDLLRIRRGSGILVRRNNGNRDQSAWLLCQAAGPASVTNNGQDVSVSIQPPNGSTRSGKKSDLLATNTVSTNNGGRIAIPKFSAATTTTRCHSLTARDACGGPVKFGADCDNLFKSESHSGCQLVENHGTSPEEHAAQNRHEPLLLELIKSGSA